MPYINSPVSRTIASGLIISSNSMKSGRHSAAREKKEFSLSFEAGRWSRISSLCKVGPPSKSACKKLVYEVVPRQNIICCNECVSVHSPLFPFIQITFVFASQDPICNWCHYWQII
jgi:hypothetical protein